MGLFRRNRGAQELYRGDAPVSAPGLDGAAPSAYAGTPSPQPAPSGYQPPDYQPPDYHVPPPTGQPDPQARQQETSHQQPAQGGPQAAPHQQPIFPQTRQQRIDKFFVPQGGQTSQTTGTVLDPATAARVQRALSGAERKTSKLGCLLIAIPVIGALAGAGFGIYAAVKGSSAVQQAIDSVSGAAPDGRHLGNTALGEPIAIRTSDASYRITVFGAVSQPADAWGYARAGADPKLVVDAEITRTDTGAEPIEFTGWNWSVIGSKGERVTGDIITNYQPSLDGPELVGGQTARGYLTFDTAVTDTALTVAAGPIGAGLATWQISATRPAGVAAAIGEAAMAEISRPGFTVTIDAPEVIAAGDARIGHRPVSGQYLVFPVTFTAVPGTTNHLGNVDSRAFVFVPDAAPAMFPEFSGVDGAFSFVSIGAAKPEQGFLAFDTAATAGTLQLRDGADRAVITWRINSG